jgi:glycosyltransferase involved in cell wall biosynthesis
MKMIHDLNGEVILTIAIPTYNGASTLQETLDSVVTQLQPGVDILISDNASTDGTAEIVSRYQSIYSQIHYRCNDENLGADRNFDLAIRKASGEFVWLFSDDDLMGLGAINAVLEALNHHPELGALFVNYAVYSPDKKCLNPRASAIEEDRFFKDGESFLSVVTIGPIFCSSNIVRRSLWESADISRFIGSNWVHYGVISSVIRNIPAYCIAHPYVRLISRAKWNTKGQLFKLTLTLARIINQLPTYGYSASVRQKLLGTIAKPLPITAITAKRDGISVTWVLARNVFYEFFLTYPLYSTLSFFLLLLPNRLYTAAYWVYKRTKRS